MNEAVHTLSSLVGPLAELVGEHGLAELTPEAALQFTVLVEEVGRAIDSLRVQAAADLAERCQPSHGAESLAAQKQCANVWELLANLTRAPRTELSRRMRLGECTRTRQSFYGEPLEPQFPLLAAALNAGQIGVDAARLIAHTLRAATSGDLELQEQAEGMMVAHATGTAYGAEPAGVPYTFSDLELDAAAWRMNLDPDGVLPSEEEALKHRGISKPVKTRNGLFSYRLNLLPEAAGALEALLDSHVSPRTRVGFPSAEEQAAAAAGQGGDGGDGAELTEAERAAGAADDPRSWAQKRHDTLFGIISEASRSDTVPHLGGEFPTVLVTIREEDLLSGRGAGWIDGIDLPISAKAVHQMICTGGMQEVVLRGDGKIVKLSTKQRNFTANQRRAIHARDGGCIIPGCRTPARRTEVHHVQEHSKGGPTDCVNGVLLCWYHHRTIDTSGWQIQMRDGVPWVKAPPWLNGYTGPNPWRRARGAPALMTDRIDDEREDDEGEQRAEAS